MGLLSVRGKDTRTWVQKFATDVLKAGPIPKHVAVIMDGNRRYAGSLNIPLQDGYIAGADKLGELLKWCKEFGVLEVTAYAFSIENFKRAEREKQILFELLKYELEEVLVDMSLENDFDGWAFNFVGDWTFFPENLKLLMAEVMLRSRHHSKLIFNVAFAYTSRNEITRCAETMRKGIMAGDLKVDDVTQELVNDVLENTYPVDLLIRTSETFRLSDFMLWQSAEGVLHFLSCQWPELSFWGLATGIFKFQRENERIQEMRKQQSKYSKVDADSKKRQQVFVENLRDANWLYLKDIIRSK